MPRVTLPPLVRSKKLIKDQKKGKKETISTKRQISEALTDLCTEELEKFKSLIELEKGFTLFSRKQLEMTKTPDIVDLMVERYSQEYLELTKSVLKKMNRTDLVQRLKDAEGKAEKTLSNQITHQVLINDLFKLKILLYNGGPATSGVLMLMLIELHGAAHRFHQRTSYSMKAE